ncbi:hypothetical protein [Micromonospora sp. HUAS LYJ1]|uniref:hypothetical protein n=1 Tax=Micromonospora sp. HUAS LYJ1 TaxID=3061626 RepID=UPI0026738226|nr:hypothetical protein [Micromonospora sp. HUAS LYJ1]WKU05349.1 hypothetical protein Q2K16_32205 [Micromonospora sp. HUAS LYJ1]
MSLMSAWQRRDDRGIPRHTVGNAIVLHPRERISAQAQALAMSVPPDPDHDLVVLDVAERMSALAWESVAASLPRRRRRGIRLVLCGEQAEPSSLVGQWLSERLSRAVVAPHGAVHRGAAGALFVDSGPGTGWIRYRPGRPPQLEGKRFPRPEWETLAADPVPTSSTGVAEPVPGGVWIHDSSDGDAARTHREWLHVNVPCRPETLVVLLGCPGSPKLSLDDVHRFWRRLGGEDRRRVRFVEFGPVDTPGTDAVGQALADTLTGPVVCAAGVPVGTPDRPRLFTVDDGGGLCWQPFAEELVYTPRERAGAPACTPRIVRHRAPLELGEPVDTGVYWYGEDVVIEVLQSGLWVRPDEVPRDADRIRATPVDPQRPVLVFDDSRGPRAHRMRAVAADIAAQLDPATRERTVPQAASVLLAATAPGPVSAAGRLVPESAVGPPTVAAPADPVPAFATEVPAVAAPAHSEPLTKEPEAATLLAVAAPSVPVEPAARSVPPPLPPPPVAPTALAPVEMTVTMAPVEMPPVETAPLDRAPAENTPLPTPPPVAHRLQPVPDRSASALPVPGRGIAEERAWLRRTLSREFDLVATTVSRVLAQHPALQGGPGATPDDALTDAVAVRLYLTAQGRTIDSALRSARKGPHVPFARCVASGLTRLPSHRGPVWLTTSLAPDRWALLGDRTLLTEWGFLGALIEPSPDLTGDTDVLIWSMTARRTAALEPDGDDHADDRVLFLPGTTFKILDRTPPVPGRHGRLLLREVGPNEIHPDGRIRDDRASFDELATTSLGRYAERWADADPVARVGEPTRPRIGAVPGLAEQTEERR